MSLDRQSIEKKDFPVGRRGYDPDAVDAHLSALADEIAEFKRTSRRRTDTLASSASAQVRAIVEAAETSAAEITREAESEAREIRDEANAEARATREQAGEQARDYVGKVSEATSTMLSRIDAMEQELSGLIESLRSGANRLTADLSLLETDLAGVSESAVPRPHFEPEPAEPESVAPTAEGVDALAGLNGADADATATIEVPTAESAAESYGPAGLTGAGSFGGASAGDESDDAEGARLIALNMALNGTPREETERYLTENFRLSDTHGLLDEVYASVEG